MWRRLPTYFPNLRLQMLPLTAEQKALLGDTGWLREVAFRCEPKTTKLEIKAFLEFVHGMEVERVNTINYQGKKKTEVDPRGKPHYYRRSDWKKAYVLFKPPEDYAHVKEWREQQQQQQLERLQELKAAAIARTRLPDFQPNAAAAVSRAVARSVVHTADAAYQKAAEQKAFVEAQLAAQRAQQRAEQGGAQGSRKSSNRKQSRKPRKR